MKPGTLDDLRRRLEEMAVSLRASIASPDDKTDTVKLDGSMGRLSRMDALQSQQMALALKQRQQQQLRRVESALGRITSGTYGRCGRCDESIGEARLEAHPEAVLCVECAS